MRLKCVVDFSHKPSIALPLFLTSTALRLLTGEQVGWDNELDSANASTPAPESPAGEEGEQGSAPLTSTSRQELMQKLAQSKDAIIVPSPGTTSPALIGALPVAAAGMVPLGAPGILPFVPATATVCVFCRFGCLLNWLFFRCRHAWSF